MMINNRKVLALRRIHVAAIGLCALGISLWPEHAGRAVGNTGGNPAFIGAGPGVAVDWQQIPLPPVVVGPFNDPPGMLACSPFTPRFEQLVTEHSVIENQEQLRHVWRRLFHGAPFDPNLVDFDSHFMLLVGGGLQHPFFGFSVNDVEETIGEFEPVMPFRDPALEAALAVRVVLSYPGPPPPKMDYEWRVIAVAIPRASLAPIILNRQVFAAP